EDLGQLKEKASNLGSEVKSSVQQIGRRARAQAGSFSAEAGQAASKSASAIGNVLGVLFRIFFILVLAVAALALFGMFIGLLFGSIALAPLKAFVIGGPVENTLVWLTLFLFFLIPLVALVTWGIRRI